MAWSPLRPLATEAYLAKQHVETDPGEGDGIDEGQPGKRDTRWDVASSPPAGEIPATITV